MKMMYSSQFRLYSGVRRGSILFHLLSVLELPGGISPTAVVDPQIIHGVEVSALLAPRRRPPLLFSLHVFSMRMIYAVVTICSWFTIHA